MGDVYKPSIIKNTLIFNIGVDYNNNPVIVDFAEFPHLLIAGTTGSGKSTLINTIIKNAINNDICTYVSDLKNEYTKYSSDVGVFGSYDEVLESLSVLNDMMENRYQILSRNEHVFFDKILYIIDEFADLIMYDSAKENKSRNKLKEYVIRLSQKSRAAHIHLVIATQRPSVDIISGIIKANFPARIACKVASPIDSRIIINRSGAEDLLGKGDAILLSSNLDVRFKISK